MPFVGQPCYKKLIHQTTSMIDMKPTNAIEMDIVKLDKSETYPNEEGLIMNQAYGVAGNDLQGDIMLN